MVILTIVNLQDGSVNEQRAEGNVAAALIRYYKQEIDWYQHHRQVIEGRCTMYICSDYTGKPVKVYTFTKVNS